jgi:hypothetical protein
MFNEQWKRIAEAATRCNAFAVCDELIREALGNGINIRIDDSAVYPTVLLAGRPIAIVITPRLSAPRPEIAVTVMGHVYPDTDLVEMRGYQYSELGWRKRIQLEGDGDDALVRGLLAAIEEALLVQKTLIQAALSKIEKGLQVLAEVTTRG